MTDDTRRPYRTSLRVAIVCPFPAGSRLGNRVTAARWARMFEELGHEAAIVDDLDDSFDVLVALHARRSAAAIADWRARFPSRPLIVALTGTDLNHDIHVDADAKRSLELADRLVVLHDLARTAVPDPHRAKTRVIRQSADPPRDAIAKADGFDVAFVAHVRSEKDPLRPALAARLAPTSSRLRVLHAGRVLTPALEDAFAEEAASNPRFIRLGELAEDETRELIARARLLVLTSSSEGGANVLGEAIVCGTPPLATRIPPCVAALGEDYPGLFDVGDTAALASLLTRAETDRRFLADLTARATARQGLFAPAIERDRWNGLLGEVVTRG